MFYKQIERKCAEWFDSPACTVRGLVAYIEQQGQMRDAQLSAIKTFLFLKLACGNAPLWQLFSQGRFNNDIDLAAERSSQRAYAFLQQHPSAVALLEYSRLYDKQGRKLSNELEDEILWHSDAEVKIEPDCTVRIGGGGKNRMLWDGIIQTLDDRCPLRMRIRNICGDETTYIFNS